MTKAALDALEQDVESARKRLADDIARLRAPATLSGFKDDLLAQLQEKKDEWVHKATDAASNGAQRAFADLKAKAAANPVAMLAIGAGLAWRLARHPPVTSLLVGVGLASLLRGKPNHGTDGISSRAGEFAGTVRTKAQQWGEEARDVTHQAVSQISSTASNVAAQAKDLSNILLEEEMRDRYLLAAAALAVGAATVISYRRRND